MATTVPPGAKLFKVIFPAIGSIDMAVMVVPGIFTIFNPPSVSDPIRHSVPPPVFSIPMADCHREDPETTNPAPGLVVPIPTFDPLLNKLLEAVQTPALLYNVCPFNPAGNKPVIAAVPAVVKRPKTSTVKVGI